jgi:hypothetical protein
MNKKILFIANDGCDYLCDSVLHGFRSLLGSDVVDYPKAERMYKTASADVAAKVRGHGFTLYGTLDDIAVERPAQLDASMLRDEYSLIIFADIWRQWELFQHLRPALDEYNTILLDGSDVPAPYKYAGFFWRRRKLWSLPGTGRIPYFKRELTPRTLVYRCYLLLPEFIARRLMRFVPWKRTAFAVPEEKICRADSQKTKLVGSHIVDAEVAAHFGAPGTSYAFDTEAAYYQDLQASRFGITTKRAGWECLRHYEIAANGCVPCFRDLGSKPDSCAPHGLHAGNCVTYTSLADLLRQISNMDDDTYRSLREGALRWAHANSTVFRAQEILFASGHADYLVA